MLAAMNHRRTVSLVLCVLAGACSKGQGPGSVPGERACTQIGCTDGATIALIKGTGWQPGGYSFALELDGAPVTCTASLPLKPCAAGPTTVCDPAERVEIVESGCALPVEQQGFTELRLPALVQNVTVAITRDGEKLAESAFTPSYIELRPNGPDCDPVCRVAREQLTIP